MRKGHYFLLLALIAGVIAFCVSRLHQQSARKEVLLDSLPELVWLREKLNLSEEQFAKASELHVAYRPICQEMCAKIAAAHANMDAVAARSRGMTPELREAIREHARIHAECEERVLEHLYRTAELFDKKQADLYLRTVLPLALGSDDGESKGSHHH
jgi:hypothetical protein